MRLARLLPLTAALLSAPALAASREVTLEVPGAYCETHAGCEGGAEVKLCVTATGGHACPGAPGARLGRKAPPSQALSANAQAWSFFRAQSQVTRSR